VWPRIGRIRAIRGKLSLIVAIRKRQLGWRTPWMKIGEVGGALWRNDFRTFLGHFAAALPQIEFAAGLNL
jgi:hypothetical protein